jgi:hypothetical protein
LTLFQHHDGVTGTAKTPVVEDYAQRMYSAIQQTYDWMLDHLGERNEELEILLSAKPIYDPHPNTSNSTNTSTMNNNDTSAAAAAAAENNPSDQGESFDHDPSSIQPCFKADNPRGLAENMCQDGQRVFAFNPLLETSQYCGTVVDKGYRNVLADWRSGGQLLLQPYFAKSDKKFNSEQVLLSGAVAADRSANERAVKRMKLCGMIAQGIHQRSDNGRVSDVWIAWGFQTNFMYMPVL